MPIEQAAYEAVAENNVGQVDPGRRRLVPLGRRSAPAGQAAAGRRVGDVVTTLPFGELPGYPYTDAGVDPVYVLHAGVVLSANDGDRKYVSEKDLQRLYNLDPAHCQTFKVGKVYPEHAIYLYPRLDGVYEVPR